jgi:DNA-binding GntR family transcriptional regulator
MTLAAYIRDDLAARILGNEISRDQLSLQSIADRHQVSLTPVRVAVSELVESGLLTKDSNGRLKIRESKLANVQLPASPAASPMDVYSKVEDYLVRLSLRGGIEFIREEATAKKFSISRSQMRNILSRLSSEGGLLKHVPRRGWELRPFRREDIDAFKEVRVMLEVGALKLAKHRLVEEDLRELLAKNVVPKTADEAVQLDNSLHAYIIEKAQNEYIADFFNRHGKYYNLLAEWERYDRDEAIVSVKQHRTILKALINRDWEAAEGALVEHIAHAHQKLRDGQLSNLKQESE